MQSPGCTGVQRGDEPGVEDFGERRGQRQLWQPWTLGIGWRRGSVVVVPAHSPVTAGEEAAPRPGDGEMTLWALFSEAVTMLG